MPPHPIEKPTQVHANPAWVPWVSGIVVCPLVCVHQWLIIAVFVVQV